MRAIVKEALFRASVLGGIYNCVIFPSYGMKLDDDSMIPSIGIEKKINRRTPKEYRDFSREDIEKLHQNSSLFTNREIEWLERAKTGNFQSLYHLGWLIVDNQGKNNTLFLDNDLIERAKTFYNWIRSQSQALPQAEQELKNSPVKGQDREQSYTEESDAFVECDLDLKPQSKLSLLRESSALNDITQDSRRLAATGNHFLSVVSEASDGCYRSLMREFYLEGQRIIESYANAMRLFLKTAPQYTLQEVEKDIKRYLNSALENIDTAQIVVGVLCFKGQIFRQNFAKAMEWFRKAADQNDSEAYMLMGILYHDGLGVEQDYVKAMKCFKKAKNLEKIELSENLVYSLQKAPLKQKPEETPRNINERMKSIRSNINFPVNNSNTMEDNNLYSMQTKDNFIVPQTFSSDDPHKGRDLDLTPKSDFSLQRGSSTLDNIKQDLRDPAVQKEEKDNRSSPKNSIVLSLTDLEKIKKSLSSRSNINSLDEDISIKSTSEKHPDAPYNLSSNHKNGRCVEEDYENFSNCYWLAAFERKADAQYKLGIMYRRGEGTSKDEEEAFECFKRAADQGHASAQYLVGKRYARLKGIGTRRDAIVLGAHQLDHVYKCEQNSIQSDEAEASRYLKLAADQGHSRAQSLIGQRYAQGKGIEKDQEEASRYLKLAAEQGDTSVKRFLRWQHEQSGERSTRRDAIILSRGGDTHPYVYYTFEQNGVEKCVLKSSRNLNLALDQRHVTDAKETFRLYELFAAKGDMTAQCLLGIMYAQGKGIAEDQAEASFYFQLAADQGCEDAQYLLGMRYKNGRGVNKSQEEARFYLNLAAEHGVEEAHYELEVMDKKGNNHKNSESTSHVILSSPSEEKHLQNNIVEEHNIARTQADSDRVSKLVAYFEENVVQNHKEDQRIHSSSTYQLNVISQVNLDPQDDQDVAVNKSWRELLETKEQWVFDLWKWRIRTERSNVLDMGVKGIGNKIASVIGLNILKESNAFIEVLRLDRNKIRDEGIIALCSGLKTNSSLTHLSLGSNKFGIRGITALSDVLKVNSFLTYLNLRDNQIGDEEAITLCLGLKTNSSLTHLILEENKIGDEGAIAIGNLLKTNASLTYLELRENKINNSGVEAVSEALKTSYSLLYLGLGNNRIGIDGGTAISSGLKANHCLQHLELGNNQIRATGAIAISEVLKINCSLLYLGLGNNQIKDAGAIAIGDALKTNSSLTTLCLTNNKIEDGGAIAIGFGLKLNFSLTELSIMNNSFSFQAQGHLDRLNKSRNIESHINF